MMPETDVAGSLSCTYIVFEYLSSRPGNVQATSLLALLDTCLLRPYFSGPLLTSSLALFDPLLHRH
jgi:hypothetical protein